MKSAVLFFGIFSLAAQNQKFEVESRLVVIPAMVTDAKGRSVDGLQAPDFVVLDNGLRRNIVVDSVDTGVAPIALVVAVQSSGISAPALEKVKKIGAMIQPVITGERGCAALVSFDSNVRWHQECTKDTDALARAFHSLEAGPQYSARMLDAVDEAIEHLRQGKNVRRVLLLISESRDRGSENDLEGVIIAAQKADVTVYSCSYSAFATAWTTLVAKRDKPPEPSIPRVNQKMATKVDLPPPEQRVDLLAAIGELARLGKGKDTEILTDMTGGATFAFTRQKGLEDAIAKLGSELHSQYVLSFTPEKPEPGYHKLQVKVSREKATVRSRPGYWVSE